jgi:asparagine synthase (glutamine-hydrolysing)
MSAFALTVGFDGDCPGTVLDGALAALGANADACRVRAHGRALIGHLPFGTTPEEEGELQPALSADGELALVFDGRLDNRDELVRAFGVATGTGDAALALAAHQRWGDAFCERLLGPWALVVVARSSGRVLCARDPLGDRTLFYHLGARTFGAASEEAAVLALPGVGAQIDETTLARFYAAAPPLRGATFFAQVRELEPGCAMAVDAAGVRAWRHWTPGARAERFRRDSDYVERFGELLTESVRCRLRAAAPPMVMMSGGVDSTSVAAVAAGIVAARGEKPLRTVSWVFDELRETDERAFMQPVVDRFSLDAHRVDGDGAWPLRDLDSWPRNPSTPLEGPYRRLRDRVYGLARVAGSRVILTGEMGDELYSGGEHWLGDLLREGRIVAAAAGLARHAHRAAFHGGRGLRCRARTMLARAVGYPGRSRSPARPVPLTDAAWQAAAGVIEPSATRRRSQAEQLLDPLFAQAATIEHGHARRWGVELRRPYRDLRLVELVLGAPAHLLYRPGETKRLLRQAMRGVLPEAVRRRSAPSPLTPLFWRGLAEREASTVEALLRRPDAVWPRYVRREWIERALEPGGVRRLGHGLEAVTFWRCLCVELWMQTRTTHAATHAASCRQGPPPLEFQAREGTTH